MAAFDETVRRLERRIERLLALPAAGLDAPLLRRCLNEIGETAD
jgi:hypothetical protein